MPYTSPSPANVAINGNQTTWWIPATNNGAVTATNVVVNVVVAPTSGLGLVTYLAGVGTFNPTTGVWSVGTLAPGTANTKWLKLVTYVADIGLAPFTVTSTISGDGVDANALNNTLIQTVTAVVTAATAGAIDDPNSCFCGNVSLNDTPCNFGATVYTLDVLSVTNSTVYVWDDTTGEYHFIPDDITLPITFSYSIWCDAVEISGPALVTIPAIVTDITPFNHTINTVEYGDLSVDDLAVLAAQYPALTLADYCWRVLRNADGDATSGEPVDCNDTQDTRTIHLCSAVDCEDIVNNCPLCPQNQLPADIQILLDAIILADEYEVELGDTIVVQHPNAQSTYVYGALGWERNDCGCVYKISQDADNDLVLGTDDAPYIDVSGLAEIEALADKVVTGIAFTGTGTKTLTLTFDDATTLTANFTDISGSADTIVQVSDSCSINFAISGVGTLLDPYIVTGTVNDGSPTFIYAPGTPGSTGNTLDVSTLFGMACPGGCTATYTLNGFPADVYDAGTIDLTGVTLTYDILITAPPGTHDINIQRTCA